VWEEGGGDDVPELVLPHDASVNQVLQRGEPLLQTEAHSPGGENEM
jgi:hypothetical protein